MPGIRKNKRSCAFTFVELILTVSLVGLLTLVIFGTLSNGLSLWKRLNQDLVLVDVNIFLDRFNTDVKSAFAFNGTGFLGFKDRVEFPGIVNFKPSVGATVGRITYSYNEDKKEVTRQPNDYSAIYTNEEALASHRLQNVSSLTFEYYYFDEAKKEYQWMKEWQEMVLPLAVQMRLKLSDGAQDYLFNRTVAILSQAS